MAYTVNVLQLEDEVCSVARDVHLARILLQAGDVVGKGKLAFNTLVQIRDEIRV